MAMPRRAALAALLLITHAAAFTAPRSRAPSLTTARAAAPPVQAFEAFEAAAIVGGAVKLVEGLLKGGGARGETLAAITELVEPLDVLAIALLYAVATPKGLAARASAVARRAAGPLRRGLADDEEKRFRREFSLVRALGRPLRTLFCTWYPLFYAVDLGCAVCRQALGVPVPAFLQPVVAAVGYAFAGGLFVCGLKRVFLARSLSWARRQRARFDTLDRVASAACWALVWTLCLENVCARTGLNLQSVLAFGGVGSVVLGLACQTPLSNVVSGILVAVTDPFEVGDEVDLGDGRAGYIEKMGWYTTEMRGYDNRAITIPNAQIAEATTINYSRVHHQLLKTKLRLRRADAPRVDALVTDIRKTLAATDGAVDDRENKNAIRVYLEGYCPDTGSPEIDVECHYLGSDTDEFLEWREGVLLAIYDAVQRADCELTWKTSLEVRRQFADGVGDV